MHIISERRRRRPIPPLPADLDTEKDGWISLVGQGGGFHDCPLLECTGWLDDLLELVGPNATVRVMGRDMEAEPVEEISMATFLARLGYE